MFSLKTFLCLLLAASSGVDASPLSRRDTGLPTLRFATRFNELAMRNTVENERARVRALHQDSQFTKRDTDTFSVDVTAQGVNYVAQVGVGCPATWYQLLLNTETGHTFVGANKPYVETETSVYTGNCASASFGFGSDFVTWSGKEWSDAVTLSSQLVIKNQSIGVASNISKSLCGYDGVLGLGTTASTVGTVENTGEIPTVADNIYSQVLNNGGDIYSRATNPYRLNAMGFQPEGSGAKFSTESSQPNGGGTLTFGGYDTAFVVGNVCYVPLTTTSPASNYWGIDMSVAYNGETIMPETAGILDVGTTLILLPTDAYNEYQKLTCSTVDQDTGLLTITPDQYDNLKSLTFQIGGESYDLIPDAQVWPRSMNAAFGGSPDKIYLVVGDSGKQCGSGLDFVLGHAFFLRYYTVYDSTPGNEQVGIAKTPYTFQVLDSPDN